MTRIASTAALAALFAMLAGGDVAGAARAPVAQTPAHLVIVSDRDGDADVYSISADGTRVGALTRNALSDESVLLSPAGGWVALQRDGIGAVLVRADGLQEKKLGKWTEPVAFSPDGQWLAVGRQDPVTETSRIELASVGRPTRTQRLGPGWPTVFSRDGRKLAFQTFGKVGVIDVQTGRRTTILSRLAEDSQVTWSPNLTGLVLQRAIEDKYGVAVGKDVFYFAAGSGVTGRLIASGPISSGVVWLDERRIGFGTFRRGVSEVRVTRVDGSGRRIIARGKIDFSSWDPAGKHVAYSVRDGHALTIASTATRARRTIDLGRGRVQNVSWSPSGRCAGLWVTSGVTAATSEIMIVGPRSGTVFRRIKSAGSAIWTPDESAIAVSGEGIDLLSLRNGRRQAVQAGGNFGIIGWLSGRQAANIPLVAPPLQLEMTTSSGFMSRTPVLEISSDGQWVAAILAEGRLDAEHIVAWTAQRRTLVRFTSAAPGLYGSYRRLSVTGTAVKWRYFYCGNYCYLGWCNADALLPGTQGCSEGGEEVSGQPRRPAPVRELKRGLELSVRGGTIALRRVADGRRQTIHSPGRLVDAELEAAGLFYAYNTGGIFRGRVVFVPFAMLFR